MIVLLISRISLVQIVVNHSAKLGSFTFFHFVQYLLLHLTLMYFVLLFLSQEGTVESSERAAMIEQYLQELVQRASDTNLKGEALHKLWPSMFAEMVRDCVLEMRDRAAFRQASLAKLTETKWRGPKVHSWRHTQTQTQTRGHSLPGRLQGSISNSSNPNPNTSSLSDLSLTTSY